MTSVPGPHLNCLRGIPFGWSRVVPLAERRPAHRHQRRPRPTGRGRRCLLILGSRTCLSWPIFRGSLAVGGGVGVGSADLHRGLAGLPPAHRHRPAGPGCGGEVRRSRALTARTETADSVARSVCPYCAVGCGQRVFVKDGQVTQIEGDPDSPISRGRLCPKGSASKSLVTSPLRQTKVRYRRPYGDASGRTWSSTPRST